jgi:uncharacterized protein (DUF4213/DUF364 family)
VTILNHIIATLDFSAAVGDVRVGLFHTAVITRHCGLAATLPRDALRQALPLVREPGRLLDQSAEELSRLAGSASIVEAAVGMATINSLLKVDRDACVEINAAELILRKGEGRNVAVVGHFPFLPRLREKVRRLWIIEKNPKEGDYAEHAADTFIPQADVVAITGTALTTHTLEHLLGLCSPRAYVVLLGDTAPLSPLFFEYGVDAVCGTVVIDPELALRCISQGATFRQIKGTKRLALQKRSGNSTRRNNSG